MCKNLGVFCQMHLLEWLNAIIRTAHQMYATNESDLASEFIQFIDEKVVPVSHLFNTWTDDDHRNLIWQSDEHRAILKRNPLAQPWLVDGSEAPACVNAFLATKCIKVFVAVMLIHAHRPQVGTPYTFCASGNAQRSRPRAEAQGVAGRVRVDGIMTLLRHAASEHQHYLVCGVRCMPLG